MLPCRIRRTIPTTLVLAIAPTLAPALVQAQDFPVKTVRIVVTWPPGGSNDVVARVMAQRLTENLGHSFVVENRPGATGTIGSELVAKSPPDGYTVMVNSATSPTPTSTRSCRTTPCAISPACCRLPLRSGCWSCIRRCRCAP